MTPAEKYRLIYGAIQPHDTAACQALAEYDASWGDWEPGQKRPKSVLNMQAVADKYGTTVKEMKKHYGCLKEKQ